MMMKPISLVLTTLFLLIIPCFLDAFSGLRHSAELAEYYQPFWGMNLQRTSDRMFMRAEDSEDWQAEFLMFRPSRTEPVTLTKLSFSMPNQQIEYKLSRALRKSASYSYGWSADTGYSFDKHFALVRFEPSIVYRYTGNFHFAVGNESELRISDLDNYFFKNRLKGTIYANLNHRSRIVLDLKSTPEITLALDHTEGGIRTSIGIGVDKMLSKKETLKGFFTLSYRFDNHKTALSVGKSQHSTSRVEYYRYFGGYTPPVEFAEVFSPIRKRGFNRVSLVLNRTVERLPQSDYELVIRRGDNLTALSRSLPPEVEEAYRNNPSAIAAYNNISSPSLIYPGQRLKIPVKQFYTVEELALTAEKRERIRELISLSETSDLVEHKLNSAFWGDKLDGMDRMNELLPYRAEIEYRELLNAQAITEISRRNYQAAIRKLRYALLLNENCPITNTNLGIAYYLDGRTVEAIKYIELGIELNSKYQTNLDLTISNEIIKQVR